MSRRVAVVTYHSGRPAGWLPAGADLLHARALNRFPFIARDDLPAPAGKLADYPAVDRAR